MRCILTVALLKGLGISNVSQLFSRHAFSKMISAKKRGQRLLEAKRKVPYLNLQAGPGVRQV